MAPAPPLEGVAAVVRRANAAAAALDGVTSAISDFLDVWSGGCDVAEASARAAPVSALRRVHARLRPLDAFDREWQLNRALAAAARRGSVQTARWLTTDFAPRTLVTDAVEAAAENGQLGVIQYLREECGAFVLFGMQEKWLAAKNGHLEVLAWLHEHTEESPSISFRTKAEEFGSEKVDRVFGCRVPDSSSMLDAAGTGGHMETLQWIVAIIDEYVHTHEGEGDRVTYEFDVKGAIAAGHADVIEWAKRADYPWLTVVWSTLGTPRTAAQTGKLDLLKWLVAEGQVDDSEITGAMWTSEVLMVAAQNGHRDIVQWITSNHYDFDSYTIVQALDFAAMHGSLEIVQVLHPLAHDEGGYAIDYAAMNNHREVVIWLDENRPRCASSSAMNAAATAGHLAMVKWLAENREEGCSATAFDQAATNGHLDVVRWLHDNRVEGCTTYAMDGAASNGHLDVVKFLHENRSEGCSPVAMDGAACNGHLDVVKFLHSNRVEGCTAWAMDRAAVRRHLDIVRFLHENRTEGCKSSTMVEVATLGNLEMLRWLHENRSEGCTTNAMDYAAAAGHVDIVRWLHENREEGCTTKAMDNAAAHGKMYVLLYLRRHRSEGCSPRAFQDAYRRNDLAIVKWLMENYPEQFDRGAVEALEVKPYMEMWLRAVGSE